LSKSQIKGVCNFSSKRFYHFEYSLNGNNVRSKKYYSQKMAHFDYVKAKDITDSEYFFADSPCKYQCEKITPLKANSSKNTLGFTGVRFQNKKYKAYLKIGSKQESLGFYSDAISAAKAFDRAAFAKYGFFASLNFPEDYTIFI
jgi:hypothetical protein